MGPPSLDAAATPSLRHWINRKIFCKSGDVCATQTVGRVDAPLLHQSAGNESDTTAAAGGVLTPRLPPDIVVPRHHLQDVASTKRQRRAETRQRGVLCRVVAELRPHTHLPTRTVAYTEAAAMRPYATIIVATCDHAETRQRGVLCRVVAELRPHTHLPTRNAHSGVYSGGCDAVENISQVRSLFGRLDG